MSRTGIPEAVGPRAPRAGLPEQVEIIAGPRGAILLPLEVREALGLKPGELLSIVRQPLSLRLEIYREFLADSWDAVSLLNRWRYLEEFLSRPLAAMDGEGGLLLPPRLFPLRAGERVILEIVRRGLCHELFLYRVGD